MHQNQFVPTAMQFLQIICKKSLTLHCSVVAVSETEYADFSISVRHQNLGFYIIFTVLGLIHMLRLYRRIVEFLQASVSINVWMLFSIQHIIDNIIQFGLLVSSLVVAAVKLLDVNHRCVLNIQD